jgi:ankyrin repeat protein
MQELGENPFLIACVHEKFEIAEYLLLKGSNPNSKNKK